MPFRYGDYVTAVIAFTRSSIVEIELDCSVMMKGDTTPVMMRCRSENQCNVLKMHATGKLGFRVTQISMNARAVVGVYEVNCFGMLGCGMLGHLQIGDSVSFLPRCRQRGVLLQS